MLHHRILLCALGTCIAEAAANPIIELVPTAAGPYSPGERVVLKFYLSQESGEADLPLRLIQFDFEKTSPELVLDESFVFDYSAQELCRTQPDYCGDGYAEFPLLSGKVVACAIAYKGRREDLVEQIVLPRSGAILVGSVGLTLPDFPGEVDVDVVYADTVDPVNRGAQVHFDFENPAAWRAADFIQTGDPRFVARDSEGGSGFVFEFVTSVRPPECPATCNDGNPCTIDECVGGVCMHRERTGVCDDRDACTLNDQCVDGACIGQSIPVCCRRNSDCDDLDPCTLDECISGACVHDSTITDCDDGDPCTQDDRCIGGGCVGQPIPSCCLADSECDDGNHCTLDRCVNGGCVHTPRATICDDGDPCTADDRCASNECFGRPIPGCCMTVEDCEDADAETEDRCVDRQCMHVVADPALSSETPLADEPAAGSGVSDDAPGSGGSETLVDDPAGQPTGDDDGSEGSPRACGAFGLIPGLFMMAGLGFARLRRRALRRRQHAPSLRAPTTRRGVRASA
jgi:hypothetical protein